MGMRFFDRTRRSPAGLGAGAALIALLLLGSTQAGAAPRATSVDWPTYGYDAFRTGYNPNETTLGVANAASLHKIWSFPLSSVTIMQPAVAAGVLVGSTRTDIVYIGSEHGDLYALNANTGSLIWQKNIGSQVTSCHDMPDAIFGASGAPTLDRANNRLFVVGGDGQVHALDLATGAESSGWPVPVTPDPTHEHTYGGVNILNGTMYVEVASYCDFTPYHGKVVEIDVASHTRLTAWFPAGRSVSGGGIWGPGGLSVDPATGHVFAATGNALAANEHMKNAEHVVELSSSLRVLGTNYPGLTGGDVDFGATPILFQPPGCPPQVAAKNKTGVLVVYTRGQVSSGPTQRLQIGNVGDWQFNGIPAWDPATNLLYIGNSSDSDQGTYRHGMVALKVNADCTLGLAWQQTVGPNFASVSPPTVANGVVYYGDGEDNQEFAFDAATGQQLWNSGATITGPIYAAPIVVNGKLFVGSWDHTFYAFAP